MVDLLEKLTQVNGVSGDEGEVRDILKNELSPWVDKIHIDRMGNLIAYKKSSKPNAGKIMLAAHMDEVGFIITRIGDDGMLKFKTIGSIDPRVLVSKRVKVGKSACPGVLGIKAIHLQEKEERDKAVELKNMYIDIGANSKEEAFDSSWVLMGENKVKTKALDDRVGCTVLAEALKEKYDADVYACFTVQEEVGLRGAGVAAYEVQPDLALVIEGTTCSNVPGVEEYMYSTIMGDGPAISIIDHTTYGNKEIVDKLINTAKEENITYQIKKSNSGGNDAGRIHITGEGIKTAVISVPCRYIHSPSSIMDFDDLKNTVKLVREFLKGCE